MSIERKLEEFVMDGHYGRPKFIHSNWRFSLRQHGQQEQCATSGWALFLAVLSCAVEAQALWAACPLTRAVILTACKEGVSHGTAAALAAARQVAGYVGEGVLLSGVLRSAVYSPMWPQLPSAHDIVHSPYLMWWVSDEDVGGVFVFDLQRTAPAFRAKWYSVETCINSLTEQAVAVLRYVGLMGLANRIEKSDVQQERALLIRAGWNAVSSMHKAAFATAREGGNLADQKRWSTLTSQAAHRLYCISNAYEALSYTPHLHQLRGLGGTYEDFLKQYVFQWGRDFNSVA